MGLTRAGNMEMIGLKCVKNILQCGTTGKPFLFGGWSMVVPLHMTQLGQLIPDPHHAPEPEAEPVLHSEHSSYHLDLGEMTISRARRATDIIQSLIPSAHYHFSTPVISTRIHHRTPLLSASIHRRTPLLPAKVH
ncbi:hypothetical protein Golob_000017 [Gossypium lobatum]|uniref:Uncharacterized protein n=1 Tax=Gossypium lobatum TaxID=34289 RepID=A0A7J8NKM2_9ROSI|nr:hypothetical protein [Gossypium lobatum]